MVKIKESKTQSRTLCVDVGKELTIFYNKYSDDRELIKFQGKFNAAIGYRTPIIKVDQIDEVIEALKTLKDYI